MYKTEKHNNSKEYFRNLQIEKDALYIMPTSTMKYAIIECNANLTGASSWIIEDIDGLFNSLMPKWNDVFVDIKFQIILREIVTELLSVCNLEKMKLEYSYLLENLKELLLEIKDLYQGGITQITSSHTSDSLKAFKVIFNKFTNNEYFLEISKELKDTSVLNSFYKRFLGFDGRKIKKVYFYNFNEINLKRFKLIDLLSVLGYEVIFRIPYFGELIEVNRCWNDIYNIPKFSFISKKENSGYENILNNNFIRMIEGTEGTEDDSDVDILTFNNITEFKENCKTNNIITFLKDSKSTYNEYKNKYLNHMFESNMGRFLFYLYECDVKENEIFLNFKTYYELITSGWIEDREYNGIRFRDYLRRNSDYFKDVHTLDEILLRIEKLKEMNEVNDLFEEPIKSRINKDKLKRFLSNPFRAYGYANFEKFNVTVNYLELITKKLRRVILNSFQGSGNLINYENHINELKTAFSNRYMKNLYDKNPEFINKIYSAITEKKIDSEYVHKEELRELFSIILSCKKDEESEDRDYGINQLEGILLRDKKIDIIDGNPTIHITDLSFNAFKEYIRAQKSSDILSLDERKVIIRNNINDDDKEFLNVILKLEDISNNNHNSYLKYTIGNLFINFKGKIIFSWIKNLRNNDIESVLFKQLSTIYESSKESGKIELDFIDEIDEEEIYKEHAEINNFNVSEVERKSLPDVAFRDLDFCENKFLLSSLLEDHPIYYSDFHNRLLLSVIISNLKKSMPDAESEIAENILTLFPQWEEVEKSNMLKVNFGGRNLRDYKLFEGVNYPKVMDKYYLLRSKYIVTEKYKIKNRYSDNQDMNSKSLVNYRLSHPRSNVFQV